MHAQPRKYIHTICLVSCKPLMAAFSYACYPKSLSFSLAISPPPPHTHTHRCRVSRARTLMALDKATHPVPPVCTTMLTAYNQNPAPGKRPAYLKWQLSLSECMNIMLRVKKITQAHTLTCMLWIHPTIYKEYTQRKFVCMFCWTISWNKNILSSSFYTQLHGSVALQW